MKETVLSNLAVALAQREPVEAARFVSQEMNGSALQSATSISVARRWASNDPSGAEESISRFATGSLHEDTIRVLIAEIRLAISKAVR
jgi:hypothetical protein